MATAGAVLAAVVGASTPSLPSFSGRGPLAHDRECAMTAIAKIVNRDRYRDTLEGTHFSSGRSSLRLEFANGWVIDGYSPLAVAFEDDPHAVLAFRPNDKVQACPIQRTYCDDDRGDWQVALRVYDFTAKESVTGLQSHCRQLLPDTD
ncbi:MAG: hypothetical protein GIX02_00210 [Candidatus Eremiobacteraeota bacterium]|nr:hypothetical protein [Candidatus Eremiobacteraeota bacterium]